MAIIRKNIDNGSLSEKQMIEGIDVYGLGMCFPYMMEMAFGEGYDSTTKH